MTTPSDPLREAGSLLLDRLVDHEVRISSEEDSREWYGHVTPAMARFRNALQAPGGAEEVARLCKACEEWYAENEKLTEAMGDLIQAGGDLFDALTERGSIPTATANFRKALQ